MPINKTNKNLWFKTQQEEDHYDDKMLASLRLKDDKEFGSKTYSILAVRSKKENFFEYNDKAK